LKLSTIATHNVLEAMRKTDVRSITYFSGSGVYGDARGKEMFEDAGPLLPVSLYGAGKLAAEGLISAYSHLFGMHALIFRPANIVGGKQTHGVIFDFVRKLRTNANQLEILGDGRQTKSYIHISDVIAAIDCAQTHHGRALISSTQSSSEHLASKEPLTPDEHPRVAVYNLASADAVCVDWIAQTIITAMKLSGAQITYTGGQSGWPGDVPIIRLATAKLQAIGWRAKFSSKDAVQMAVQEMLTDKT
jgi:UDP-glucose 4-epimerase